jgi:cystathionine gamma-synthase
LERQTASAEAIARWLTTAPGVDAVHHPGLPLHPGYAVHRRQARGASAMIAFAMASETLAHHVLESVRLIQYAESLGGVESLITYPILQTHADVPPAEREALGIDARLLRLSVGLEDPADLLADLAQALGAAATSPA